MGLEALSSVEMPILTLNVYIYGTFGKISFLQVVVFKIHGHFGMERCAKNNKLLIKIRKNWICYKYVISCFVFTPILTQHPFWYYRNVGKVRFQIFSNFDPQRRKNSKCLRFLAKNFLIGTYKYFFTLGTFCISRYTYVVKIGKFSWL